MSLLIVGSIALDSVKTPFGEVREALGGSAVYASMASKHFSQTEIIGVIGKDFPEEHLKLLEDNKISIIGVEKVDGKTFRWKGVYNDLNKAETLDTQLNVFADFQPKLSEKHQNTEYVFLGNIDPVLQLDVLNKIKNPRITACDTMNFWISGKLEKLIEVIKEVDILFINEDELKMLTGENNIFKAAEITEKYNLKLIVIKKGEHGAIAVKNDFVFFAPVFPLKRVVDPTGAGDSFAGGFMGYLAKSDNFNEKTIKNAMIYGTILASFDVEDFSLNKLSKVSSEEIEFRKEKIRQSVIF
ncbi:MAG: sugar kinase [Candidatus Cloacimonas sp. 4484_275]|nr:MAG: sugar kinase [Candidatus Cloacimonas sp. 4484_275]